MGTSGRGEHRQDPGQVGRETLRSRSLALSIWVIPPERTVAGRSMLPLILANLETLAS